MSDDRYPRSTSPQDDYHGRDDAGDYARDYGSGRHDSYSSARSYQAAGQLGRDADRNRDAGGDRYGQRGSTQGRYRQDHSGQGNYGQAGFGQRGGGGSDYGRDRGYQQDRSGNEYYGSYAGDGRRFESAGRHRDRDDDDHRLGQTSGRNDYGRQPQGYDYEERGFLNRAGDEVRSWFGDDEAERRRERDARMDEQRQSQRFNDDGDSHYHEWRRGQIDAFDRDYQEYREENRQRFQSEFAAWRTARQGQRDLLSKVTEHMEVVGSDGEHVGTVDKNRDDRLILTKSDADAGGRHHSVPSRWIASVDDKVTLTKTAQEAKNHWRDEENSSAILGDRHQQGGYSAGRAASASQASSSGQGRDSGQGEPSGQTSASSTAGEGRTDLNRSFSGTF
ncbi:DUF2171 domain-containing protein [Sphingomonas aerophila]|uniref:DUF2171 domain-containing protein n=1 Tax=Sphingomonas aerophila TaxID=1344948 RepID=A0A7W9BFG9_9SPHN|nr:DUF2171 domain-containing protein [Sphingomonas aerophila]MBB5715979.1 hypothetical protein [Sphingomonas aerophila]